MSKQSLPPRKRKRKFPPPAKYRDRQRLAALAEYYDHQSDDAAIAEAEAAYRSVETAMIQVPIDLVPKIEKLIGKRAG